MLNTASITTIIMDAGVNVHACIHTYSGLSSYLDAQLLILSVLKMKSQTTPMPHPPNSVSHLSLNIPRMMHAIRDRAGLNTPCSILCSDNVFPSFKTANSFTLIASSDFSSLWTIPRGQEYNHARYEKSTHLYHLEYR